MLNYIFRRFLYMIVVVLLLSLVSFIVIQLPPGDYLTRYIRQLETATSTEIGDQLLEALKERYALDLPIHRQYLKWIGNIILRGDFGESIVFQKSVMKLIGERIMLTMIMSFCSMIFVYAVAIPIGIYSATHQYSLTDYLFIFVGFIGLATPNFLLALALMLLFKRVLGMDVGGLFSLKYQLLPWSIGKVWDLIKHLPIPLIVLGTAGTAGMIRFLRANLLDQLNKQYVITARAKGVKEIRLLFKYPIRIAINPMVSGIGGILTSIVSGSAIVSIVLNLPTTGPILLNAVMQQDMYLAASCMFLLSILGVIGVFISDMLLTVVDPRIRFSRKVY